MGVVDHYVVAASDELATLAVASTQSHRGAGFFAWEPEWIPGVGWAPGEGNPNDNMTMFDWEGRALPPVRLRPSRH